MSVNAIAIWDYGTFGGPMNATATGLKFQFLASFRDTVSGISRLVAGIEADIASDATGAQIVTACTDAIVAAGVSVQMTVPRGNVRLPGFTTGA